MQARAGAIDELLASGALNDPTGIAKDDITLELERLSSSSDVELQLQQMKAALPGGEAPKQIEGQQQAAAQPATPAAEPVAAEPAAPAAPPAEPNTSGGGQA
jgi:phage shock protein A